MIYGEHFENFIVNNVFVRLQLQICSLKQKYHLLPKIFFAKLLLNDYLVGYQPSVQRTLITGLDPSVHWNVTGEIIVGSQCASCVLPVVFQWSSSVFQLCKLTLDRHWNTTGCDHQPVWFQWHPSVLVAPVVFQCGLSSGIPVYWQNLVWRSLGQVTSQHATPHVSNWYGESCLS